MPIVTAFKIDLANTALLATKSPTDIVASVIGLYDETCLAIVPTPTVVDSLSVLVDAKILLRVSEIEINASVIVVDADLGAVTLSDIDDVGSTILLNADIKRLAIPAPIVIAGSDNILVALSILAITPVPILIDDSEIVRSEAIERCKVSVIS
jgi:hypothetical protein